MLQRSRALQGSSLQWVSNLGWTALHFAAMMSNLALVDWMLEEGASALATGEDGCMPGDCATHSEVRKRLFKTGALCTKKHVILLCESSDSCATTSAPRS